jgi:hypothetical protein
MFNNYSLYKLKDSYWIKCYLIWQCQASYQLVRFRCLSFAQICLLLHYVGEEVDDIFDTLADKEDDKDFKNNMTVVSGSVY